MSLKVIFEALLQPEKLLGIAILCVHVVVVSVHYRNSDSDVSLAGQPLHKREEGSGVIHVPI
jgi:hypothetical protein